MPHSYIPIFRRIAPGTLLVDRRESPMDALPDSGLTNGNHMLFRGSQGLPLYSEQQTYIARTDMP